MTSDLVHSLSVYLYQRQGDFVFMTFDRNASHSADTYIETPYVSQEELEKVIQDYLDDLEYERIGT